MNVVSVIRSTTRWVEWQSALFRKFCGVDVFFVNNGPESHKMSVDLKRLGVAHHTMEPNNEGNPSISHSVALSWIARRFLRESTEPLLILDMDIFPMRPVDLSAALNGCHAAGQMICSDQYYHLWPGLLFIGADAPDREHIGLRAVVMAYSPVEIRLDSGGETWFWIQNRNPVIRWLGCRDMVAADLPEPLRPRYDERHLFEVKGDHFFHIRGATNWFGIDAELSEQRFRLAEDYLRTLLDG